MRTAAARPWFVAVLVVLALPVLSGIGLAQCPVPPQYTNTTSTTAGDLQLVMGTDKYHYTVGDPVQFYLSVYNSGTTTVVIPNPWQISAIHSWAVLPDSCLSIYEPEGCMADSPFNWPQGVFFFGLPMPVAAGECKTFTTTWDGIHQWADAGYSVVPAIYKVIGGFLVGGDYTTSQGAPLVPMLAHIEIAPAEGVPAVLTTWGSIKSIYYR